MAKPRATTIHKLAKLVAERKEHSASITKVEGPLRDDARLRFRKKRGLVRVVYRVIRRGTREFVEYFELGKEKRIPKTKYVTVAMLSYRVQRTPPKPIKTKLLRVARDKCFTIKR